VTTEASVNRYDPFSHILGNNSLLKEAIRIAKIAAKTQSNVLIEGESGCGKRQFAEAIQQGSLIAGEPFVEQDCRLPEEELTEQLFGNSERQQGGNLERANQSTLLLLHIGEMPLKIQQRLVKVLQEGQFHCAGENRLRPLQVRIIATTSRDLPQEIAFNGTFLSSLYDHLATFNLQLPALREHLEDIPLLAAHTLDSMNRKNATDKKLAAELLDAFAYYSWPGNVRELINVMERAYYLSLEQNILSSKDLPEEILRSYREKGIGQSRQSTEEITKRIECNDEKAKIEKAIRLTDYNMTLAAKELGIARSTLYRKIERFGIKLKAEIVSR
jgi:DNA-binding NtrC family response regulator